jgi:uncharacterized protein
LAVNDIALLCGLIVLAAALYSSVGHGGASGYLAAMALFGLAPTVMKPTALTLNILVAALATLRWHTAGQANWRALLPLVLTSIPAAFIGGAIHLPGTWYRVLVGVVLLAAAARLFYALRPQANGTTKESAVPWLGGSATGAGVGILSGLTGTGGGIFLSPVLLFAGWANLKQSAGITAPFILVNSLAGLAGNMSSVGALPAELPYFAAAALLGAAIGLQFGVRWASNVMLQRGLGAVLVIAAGKFILT